MGEVGSSHVLTMTQFRAGFGAEIRHRRLCYALPQSEVAYRAAIVRSSISDIELGKANLTLDAVVRLAEAFDVRASALIRLAEERADRMELSRQRADAARRD